MPEDPWQDPSAKRWIKNVLTDMAPKLADSAFTISVVPEDREGDVKYWVELGAAICMDKPIIGLVLGDAPVPAKLALVADELVHCPNGVDEEATERLHEAISRMQDKLDL
jgi:hypothetical protein